MNIPEGTVLAHAKRHGWTQQIQVATQQQSDAITPVQPVPQSIAAILSERKDRTKLGLRSMPLRLLNRRQSIETSWGLPEKVKDVAGVHKTLWPDQPETNQILNIGILTGAIPVYDAKTGEDRIEPQES